MSEQSDRLRAALLPFAVYARIVLAQAEARDAPLRDDDIVFKLDTVAITVGDLRRAVDAMEVRHVAQ